MSNLSGKTLGKVIIGELIARGGMAEVYVGEHTALNRNVAVKIMREHVEADPDNRKRFEREARVVAGLRHPNIIQVFDYEFVEEQPCLVMEYVPGASLGSYLKALHRRGEKLPISMVVRILSMLASAIDYAHSQNIIHRDLKPANVLLRSSSGPIDENHPLPEDVEPILTDFGLVRLLDSTIQTSTGTVSGTPAYMSPEQARGDKLDFKTDIYSLGVMLYEMLAGSVPFDAESSLGVLMKHLNEAPPSISNISSDLQAVISRALAKNPDFRFSSAKQMMDEFTAVFNGETISKATLNISKAAQASLLTSTPARPFNWNWVFGAILTLAFAFVGYRYWAASSAPSQEVVGRVSYLDSSALLDKMTISLDGLPALESGTHYEAWLLSQGGETRLRVGEIQMGAENRGELIFLNPNQRNILEGFDQVEITIEPNNDPAPNQSSQDVAASSIFPPLALVHVRHVIVKFDSAPNDIALIQGLRLSTDLLNENVLDLQNAYAGGDEVAMRLTIEEIINQVTGRQSPVQYKDWNKDGKLDDSSDGYGLLFNGDPGYDEQGYISQIKSHAEFSASSLDATENIKIHGGHVVICMENMEGWSEQLVEKAIALNEMPFGGAMGVTVTEMVTLSSRIRSGVDSNGNELIEPILGECGAVTAYEHAYYMANMPLLPGAHRIPLPAPTETK